jgi:hypothetical protein
VFGNEPFLALFMEYGAQTRGIAFARDPASPWIPLLNLFLEVDFTTERKQLYR